MAQRGVKLEQERFCCSIGQHLPNDPVTTVCGHSFCRSCINTHWDEEEERGSYSCPQCRQTFTPRPVLEKNTMIADLLEVLKNLGLQAAPERTERLKELRLQQPGKKPRADFLQYSQIFTLDPNTAHIYLSLSEGNRRVSRKSKVQSYPPHKDRFTKRCQVLSKEGLNPPCYWEVEVRDIEVIGVAVTDKKIWRRGKSTKCRFGFYHQSWMLRCNGVSHDFAFNGNKIPVSGPVSSRVGVYYNEGVLEFYRVVSDTTVTLLKRVKTKSTEPLYAGLLVYRFGSTAEFC